MKRRVSFMIVMFTTMALLFGIVAVASVGATKKGTEGCTPGYWKQSQHFGSWTGYTQNELFKDAGFDDAFPGKTLLDVLGQGGGGLNALGRHTVAALLNASSSIDYPYSTGDVITMFNNAYPGTDGAYEALKNIFAGFNELGCPLGRAEL